MELFSAGFWGVFLIVLGLALVVKYVLNIDFPVARVMFALMLIYVGAFLLLGRKHEPGQGNKVIFNESVSSYSAGQDSYECVFGKASLDLSSAKLEADQRIKVSCTFGEYIILLNPALNYEIQSSSAFGSFTMPGNQNHSFGNATYHTKNYDDSLPKLIIKAEVAFGSMIVKFRD